MSGERISEQPLLIGQQLSVLSAAESLEQRRRPLDVREQEGDGAAQTLRREPPWRGAWPSPKVVSTRTFRAVCCLPAAV
jgi:hypothetical protein